MTQVCVDMVIVDVPAAADYSANNMCSNVVRQHWQKVRLKRIACPGIWLPSLHNLQ